MKTIFLDFAETIGYRAKPEFENDLDIINRHVEPTIKNLSKLYKIHCIRSNIYDRTLSFNNFKLEYDFTVNHFHHFLSNYYSHSIALTKSKKIASDKYNILCHKLFPDVIPFLNKYSKLSNIYILSDGRPSRRKTIELLGLDKYCLDIFISDEIGFLKTDINFYKYVFKKVNIQGNIYFIDDCPNNIDTMSQYKKIIGVIIDRKKVIKNNKPKHKYKIINQLTTNLLMKQ